MAYERTKLGCGCEIYVASGDYIHLCEEGRALADTLIAAVEEWVPIGGAENPVKMPAAQAADKALTRHLLPTA